MLNKQITVRELRVDDIFIVSKMLMKIANKSDKAITKLLVSKSEGFDKLKDKERAEREIETGVQLAEIVFKTCLFHAERDFKKWLASLLQCSKRRIGKLSISDLREIIDQIKQNEDISGFFGEAFASFNKMNKSAKGSIKK